eukprot:CAMPEP_0171096692 /NCGR_PEP_ID=MMETSP0766_2-20121228/45623_1 /TAXON_ID=439317 /ORGANISM="Gambierdiscus australes, Strain CAWD 149" /LENGTH=367 /DNA_ID=CAMNT_0011555731 /DNA_START=60 /DNA_END=1163 /DNA_ORIENTATION=+
MAGWSTTGAIVCCISFYLTLGTSAHLAEPQPIEDSEALVQTLTRVGQQPSDMLHGPGGKLLEAWAKMGAKIMARQEKVMAHLQDKVVSKLQAQFNGSASVARREAQLEAANAAEEARIKKAKEEWEARLEMERLAQKAEEEAQATEAKKAKYGEAMTYVVRDPMGREIKVQFRASTRLRVLKSSISKRLSIPLQELNFTYADLPLPSNETPESIGMLDNDVVEVTSESLELEKREKGKAEEFAVKQAQQRAEEQQHELQVALKKAQVRMLKAKEAEKVQKQQRKNRDLKKTDKVLLRFVNAQGKEIKLAFKKSNRMGPLAALVSKRFGMDEKRISFHYGPDNTKIRPDDTARSLGFKDEELIEVKEG